MRLLLLALAAVSTAAGCSSSGGFDSDWERQNRKNEPTEEAVQPPAYPSSGTLIEYQVADADGFRFFVDGATLSIAKDGIVRYVLVAKSPGGVQNVTYEGMRCANGGQRIFAFGRPDGTWSLSRAGWRSLSASGAQPRHVVLYRDFFCPQGEPIRDSGEGVRALQDGGHPFAKGFASPLPGVYTR